MQELLTPKPKVRAQPLEPPYAYRINDACRLLGICRTSAYGMVHRGELKLIRIAGRTLVPRSELERLTRVDNAI